MKNKSHPIDGTESTILNQIQIRLLLPDEQERYNQLLDEQHYLKHPKKIVGERLQYVVEHDGRWLALLSWAAGSYHLKDRDEWIGWRDDQRRVRLPFVVNNCRFLILKNVHYPNLATRAMRLCLERLSEDWMQAYGHGVLVAESFVDPQLFRGTAYKANGWTLLGTTKGFGRTRREYYTEHKTPKQLYVKKLHDQALEFLCAEQMPQPWADGELKEKIRCRSTIAQLRTIRDCFGNLPDYRTGPNWHYTTSGLFALIFCAVLCGISSGQRDLAEFSEDLSQAQLRALGFRRNRKTGIIPTPSESTFFRILSKTPPEKTQEVLLNALDVILGPATKNIIIIDGKALNSSQGLQLVSAFCAETGRWLGSEAVAEKSNEIPAGRTLIKQCADDHTIVLGDALHTQTETSTVIVQECGADTFMTVKGNQKGLQDTLQTILETHEKCDFPPSAPNH